MINRQDISVNKPTLEPDFGSFTGVTGKIDTTHISYNESKDLSKSPKIHLLYQHLWSSLKCRQTETASIAPLLSIKTHVTSANHFLERQAALFSISLSVRHDCWKSVPPVNPQNYKHVFILIWNILEATCWSETVEFLEFHGGFLWVSSPRQRSGLQLSF